MLSSRKFSVLLLASLASISMVSTAMPLAPNYCEHMGYNYTMHQVENKSYSQGICSFSENASCPADAFLNGTCGQEYVKNLSCREKGEAVFTEFESCCSGLEPYLPPGAIGQPVCEPEKSFLQEISGVLKFSIMLVQHIFLG